MIINIYTVYILRSNVRRERYLYKNICTTMYLRFVYIRLKGREFILFNLAYSGEWKSIMKFRFTYTSSKFSKLGVEVNKFSKPITYLNKKYIVLFNQFFFQFIIISSITFSWFIILSIFTSLKVLFA